MSAINEPFPLPIKRIHPDHPSQTERYFTPKFHIPKLTQLSLEHPASDQVVLIHSNRIGLLTLAPNHPVIKEQKQIERIGFNQQFEDNVVSGKGKKGGRKIKQSSVICKIYCKDETIYTVVGCIKCSLIEINKKLIDNPQWIVSDTWSKGYIAIFHWPLATDEEVDKSLLTFEEYNKIIESGLVDNLADNQDDKLNDQNENQDENQDDKLIDQNNSDNIQSNVQSDKPI